jgi:hypothetical protein
MELILQGIRREIDKADYNAIWNQHKKAPPGSPAALL